MYEITVMYKRKLKLESIKQTFQDDTYEQAIDSADLFLKKRHIKDNEVVSYKVIKIIKCAHCEKENYLAKGVNRCSCGAVYNNFGEEIAHSSA
jgi:hypothetical protein